MNNNPLKFIIFISLLFAGCGKCGKDVYLGEFKLIPKSIEDWFPYNGIDELKFKNAEGEVLNLKIADRKEELINQVYRYTCYENYNDEASELIDGEYKYVNYQGTFNEMNYSVSISIMVEGINYSNNSSKIRLKDYVTYQVLVDNGPYGCMYRYTVDFRDNPETNESGYTFFPEFLKETDINGKTYNDVWYFCTDYQSSIYVQQGHGIIAFQGLNDEVWELQL